MDKQKIESLLKNEEFMKKILPMQTPEEVQAEFKKEGVELSIEEIEALGSIINKYLEKGGKPLSEDELENIAGGHDCSVQLAIVMGVELGVVGGVIAAGAAAIGGTVMLGKWISKKYKNKKKKL